MNEPKKKKRVLTRKPRSLKTGGDGSTVYTYYKSFCYIRGNKFPLILAIKKLVPMVRNVSKKWYPSGE